jgi:hypothetical protein
MNGGGFVAGFAMIYTIAIAILTFIIHSAFAFAVDRDARSLYAAVAA